MAMVTYRPISQFFLIVHEYVSIASICSKASIGRVLHTHVDPHLQCGYERWMLPAPAAAAAARPPPTPPPSPSPTKRDRCRDCQRRSRPGQVWCGRRCCRLRRCRRGGHWGRRGFCSCSVLFLRDVLVSNRRSRISMPATDFSEQKTENMCLT